MDNSFWSLIPPILAIIMGLMTRRVLCSLGVGIAASALFIANFNLGETIYLIWEGGKGVFVDEGAFNSGDIFLLIFILILGVLTSLINIMGGTRAFGDFMSKRVQTRVGAQIMTMIFGIIIFIDDYFKSLTVLQWTMQVTVNQYNARA